METTQPSSTGDTVVEIATEPEDAPVGVDPSSALRPKMRVFGDAGRPLGTIDSLEYDAVSGYLSSLVVRHGVFGRAHTFVSADCVTQINEDSVMLQISLADFKSLPTVEGH
jgi:hypothetical protein